MARAYPVHAAAAFSGDGVVVFGGGVPCLSFAPVFGDSVASCRDDLMFSRCVLLGAWVRLLSASIRGVFLSR